MADGFGDRDPLMEHTDDRGDDDDGDITGAFESGSASTPGPSEQIPMQTRTTTMNRQCSSDTVENSFIEGDTGNRTTFDSLKIQVANETLSQKYPNYGKDGNLLTLKVSKTKYPEKIVVIGPRGGETPLFKADNETINPKLPKTITKTLGPERQVLIQQKDDEIEKMI